MDSRLGILFDKANTMIFTHIYEMRNEGIHLFNHPQQS